MRTNIEINDDLLKEAMMITKDKKQKQTCQLCFAGIDNLISTERGV